MHLTQHLTRVLALSANPAPAPSPPGLAQRGQERLPPLQLITPTVCWDTFIPAHRGRIPISQLTAACLPALAINVNHSEQPTPCPSLSFALRRTSEWSWGSEMWNSHSPPRKAQFLVSGHLQDQLHYQPVQLTATYGREGRAFPNSMKKTRGPSGSLALWDLPWVMGWGGIRQLYPLDTVSRPSHSPIHQF